MTLGAGLVLFFGWQIPVRFEQGGEFVGGCLLIVLGLIVGWLTVSGRLYVHAHVHGSGERAHSHWHLHFGRQHSHRPTIHTVLPGALGAVFAVSGLRALDPVAAALEHPGRDARISARCCFSSRFSRWES